MSFHKWSRTHSTKPEYDRVDPIERHLGIIVKCYKNQYRITSDSVISFEDNNRVLDLARELKNRTGTKHKAIKYTSQSILKTN